MPVNRHRTNNQHVFSKFHSYVTYNGDPYLDDVHTPVTNNGSYADMWDEVHPTYHADRKAGRLVFGDLDRTVTTRTLVPGSHIRTTTDIPSGDVYIRKSEGDLALLAEQCLIPPIENFRSNRDAMGQEALIDAYAKIRSDSIMSGEIMGSIGQSLGMLRKPFGGSLRLLKQCFNSAKKSYRKTNSSVAKANADAWLEYRYGWVPLFGDFRTGMRLYSQGENRLSEARKVARASKLGSESKTQQTSNVMTVEPSWFNVTGSVDCNTTFAGHGGVIYKIDARTQAQALSEELRIGADSLASTAWELIPFSFVVDWFVHVGPWLEAVNLPPSVTVLGDWCTVTSKNTRVFNISEMKWWHATRGQWDYAMPGKSTYVEDKVVRTCNLGPPSYPPVTLRLPGVVRATDALALLTSPILGLLNKLAH